MASANGSTDDDFHVRVVSRRYVKASDASVAPHVVAVSNLDLVPQTGAFCMSCIYPWSPSSSSRDGFSAVVACFEAGLPSLLNHFFPLAGRIASNPRSGLPELHCGNQGAELVVGEARVGLASLDYSTQEASLERIVLPYGGVALSVQLVSFACGGFTVSWCTNHVLVDGAALCMLVGAWSELARSGTLALGSHSQPNHDRSVFRPRAPPSYGAALDESFAPLPDADPHRHRQQVDDGDSIVKRLYYVEARDVARLRDAATSRDRDREGQRAPSRLEAVSAYLWKALAQVHIHGRCRVGLVVDGRRRFTSPGLRASMRSYVGNATTLVVREASAQELVRMPLPEVAALVREVVSAPAYDEHFQELVDWVEEHKGRRYAQTASQGLGTPAVIISSFLAADVDTDFGFGHAALMLPMVAARLSSGFVRIMAVPGGRGSSWIVGASLQPRLAAALDSVIFKPLTAEHLGLRLVSTKDHKSRL